MSCEKLSDTIPIGDRSLPQYLNDLYPIYQEQIASGEFYFHNKPIHVFTALNFNLQHLTFEHLTTKGNNDRLYNVQRCERLPWIKDILSGCCDPCGNYRLFRDKKWNGNKKAARYIIWCVEEDYVIILEERERDVMLITAYCVLYEKKRRDLQRAYENR